MHDGLIKVRSTPGLETSFEVYLPFRQANQTFSHEFSILQDTSPARIAANENNTKPKHAYKLLIVEDDEEILQYLINEFSVQYKVYSAVNGKDGLRVAQNVVPDIIITDIIMPEMNGIELCKHLRASITTSHIPIIILSARPNPEHQIEGLDAGANTYLVKPFHIQVLKNQVEQLIQLKETIYRKFIKATDLLPGEVLNNDLDKQFLEKVLDYIEANLSNPNLSVDELASQVFLSKVQLYRKIKAITGMSVIEFITSIRLRKAARLIVEKQMSFAQIAYETGFSSPSYFTKCFREHYGKTPREYIAAYLEKQEGEDNKDLQRE
jgi:YesN/AraC family two-component response regulator